MKTIIHGNSENMSEISDGAVDLVFGSPPYWGQDAEQALHAPRTEQKNWEVVRSQVLNYALSLGKVWQEVERILSPKGTVVWQIKDIRYGKWLIPLVHQHRQGLENTGLRWITQVQWLSSMVRPKLKPSFLRKPKRGNWHVLDPETFLVFSREHFFDEPRNEKLWLAQLDQEAEREEWINPLWVTTRGRFRNNHPHASPIPPVRRLLKLFTEPGDLVCDPFAGAGNVLYQARSLGCNVIGYELDHERCKVARKLLSGIL